VSRGFLRQRPNCRIAQRVVELQVAEHFLRERPLRLGGGDAGRNLDLTGGVRAGCDAGMGFARNRLARPATRLNSGRTDMSA
jgi:hypothetical protein